MSIREHPHSERKSPSVKFASNVVSTVHHIPIRDPSLRSRLFYNRSDYFQFRREIGFFASWSLPQDNSEKKCIESSDPKKPQSNFLQDAGSISSGDTATTASTSRSDDSASTISTVVTADASPKLVAAHEQGNDYLSLTMKKNNMRRGMERKTMYSATTTMGSVDSLASNKSFDPFSSAQANFPRSQNNNISTSQKTLFEGKENRQMPNKENDLLRQIAEDIVVREENSWRRSGCSVSNLTTKEVECPFIW